MTRPAIRRTAADLPAPGTTYSRSAQRDGRKGNAIVLPPEHVRAPCCYPHAPDGRYVLSAASHGKGVWLCFRCLQWATVLDRWRQQMARRVA